MLDNLYFSWTIGPESDQLFGLARYNNIMVIDEDLEDLDPNKVQAKEGISFGMAFFRIDITF